MRKLEFKSSCHRNKWQALQNKARGVTCKAKGSLNVKAAPGLGRSPVAFGLPTPGFWGAPLADFSKHLFISRGIFVVVVHTLRHIQLWPHGLQHARLPCPSLSPSLLKLMSIEMVIPSNHLILCCPLLLLPSVFPSIRVFSRVSSFHQVARVLDLQL